MSTAKSMAAQYLNGKRATLGQASNLGRLKSSAANLATSTSTLNQTSTGGRASGIRAPSGGSAARLRSTSMTNLVAEQKQQQSAGADQARPSRLQRPASRNALDTIHMGMNARYAQVQSKVLLQNIRPQARRASPTNTGLGGPAAAKSQQSKLQPAPARPGPAAGPTRKSSGGRQQAAGDKLQLQARLRQLQDELEAKELQRLELSRELERERLDKAEQLQAAKSELQDKALEHERQSEEYHQKLLEAYELADQNRRAADNVLSESRQRDDKARKRIEELEQQLAELKEFVAMKEEMAGKMSELREQIREERERYEEKTRSLHQVFESEKIRPTIDQKTSNYFKRVKPMLESCESVNNLHQEQPYGRQSSSPGEARLRQHHQSEQDIYGSKLSTRMQDTARSAWKASRKFANSVITGSVGGLSACRQCSARRRSSNISFEPTHEAANGHCKPGRPANQSSEQQLMTSVVEVGALRHPAASGPDELPISGRPEAERAGSSAPVIMDQPGPGGAAATNVSIHVDENNKLTIVTKFNGGPQLDEQPAGPTSATNQLHQGRAELAPSSSSSGSSASSSSGCCSERSRCESSSSGRGTAASDHEADGSSSASQSGDCLDSSVGQPAANGPAMQHKAAEQVQVPHQQPQHESAGPEPQATRRPKRRAALFGAGRVFSGSQVSLNKLRGFFGQVAAAKKPPTMQGQQFFQRRQVTEPHNGDPFINGQAGGPASCRGRGRIEPDCQATNCAHQSGPEGGRAGSDEQPWQPNAQQLGQGDSLHTNTIRPPAPCQPALEQVEQVPIRRNELPDAGKHQSGAIGGVLAASS